MGTHQLACVTGPQVSQVGGPAQLRWVGMRAPRELALVFLSCVFEICVLEMHERQG